MDKSIFMQTQVKNNAEDLPKASLDMKNWEEQMKHKDEELEKETSGQTTLPPVRSKNTDKIKKASGKQNGADNKPKRIKSHDYSAWDKFDEDNACKEALNKSHELALRHKNEGNIFVQQQRWAKAIGCYNQAILAFSNDHEFYANRALCLLKLDCYRYAAADCTIAIQLDETYVAAYFRRAAARVHLKQYKEAKQDLEKVLQLDPLNTEAMAILIEIGNKIKVSESDITLEENTKTSSETSTIVGEIEVDAKQVAAASEKFDVISQWYNAVANRTTLYKTYGWLIRAVICGLMMIDSLGSLFTKVGIFLESIHLFLSALLRDNFHRHRE